jgi:hypothetical protein
MATVGAVRVGKSLNRCIVEELDRGVCLNWGGGLSAALLEFQVTVVQR